MTNENKCTWEVVKPFEYENKSYQPGEKFSVPYSDSVAEMIKVGTLKIICAKDKECKFITLEDCEIENKLVLAGIEFDHICNSVMLDLINKNKIKTINCMSKN